MSTQTDCLILQDVLMQIGGKTERVKVELRLLGSHRELDHSYIKAAEIVLEYKDELTSPVPNCSNIFILHNKTTGKYKIYCDTDPLAKLGRLRKDCRIELIACCVDGPEIRQHLGEYKMDVWAWFKDSINIDKTLALMREYRMPPELR